MHPDYIEKGGLPSFEVILQDFLHQNLSKRYSYLLFRRSSLREMLSGLSEKGWSMPKCPLVRSLEDGKIHTTETVNMMVEGSPRFEVITSPLQDETDFEGITNMPGVPGMNHAWTNIGVRENRQFFKVV
jgi:hypothetical protein